MIFHLIPIIFLIAFSACGFGLSGGGVYCDFIRFAFAFPSEILKDLRLYGSSARKRVIFRLRSGRLAVGYRGKHFVYTDYRIWQKYQYRYYFANGVGPPRSVKPVDVGKYFGGRQKNYYLPEQAHKHGYDAFAERLFEGNPAAVCVLDEWLPDELMQSVAIENNLSETACVVRENGAYGGIER